MVAIVALEAGTVEVGPLGLVRLLRQVGGPLLVEDLEGDVIADARGMGVQAVEADGFRCWRCWIESKREDDRSVREG